MRAAWLILATTVLGVIAVAALVGTSTERYETTTLLLVTGEGGNGSSLTASVTDVLGSDAFLAQLVLDFDPDAADTTSIDVERIPSSQIISVTVESADRNRSQQLASQIFPTLETVVADTGAIDPEPVLLVEVFDVPAEATEVSSTRWPVLLVGGLAGALVGLLATTIGMRRRPSTVDDLAQASEAAGLAFRSALPSFRSSPTSNAHDAAYALLRAGLDESWPRPLSSLVVLASVRDDATCDLALGLSLVAQDHGSRTLLIDADVKEGTLSRYLGADQTAGVAEWLDGTLDGEPEPMPLPAGPPWFASMSPGGSDVRFVPAGRSLSPSHEIAPMTTMFERRTDIDLKIIVAPVAPGPIPVAEVIDSAGGVVVAATTGRTDVSRLRELGDLVRSVGAQDRTLGVVLESDALRVLTRHEALHA